MASSVVASSTVAFRRRIVNAMCCCCCRCYFFFFCIVRFLSLSLVFYISHDDRSFFFFLLFFSRLYPPFVYSLPKYLFTCVYIYKEINRNGGWRRRGAVPAVIGRHALFSFSFSLSLLLLSAPDTRFILAINFFFSLPSIRPLCPPLIPRLLFHFNRATGRRKRIFFFFFSN